MKTLIKNIIILVFIVGTIIGIYLGALLPLAKSQSFIQVQQKLQTVKSVEDFQSFYDTPLQMYSPIGQEEVVKFTASTVGDVLGQTRGNEAVSRWFVAYMEPYMFPNELRHNLLMGNMYEFLWQSYKKDEDFKKAEDYYLRAHVLGPKIPPPLYRLVGMYQQKGDKENMQKFAQIILANWEDPKVREVVK